jgi:hypothetical protein
MRVAMCEGDDQALFVCAKVDFRALAPPKRLSRAPAKKKRMLQLLPRRVAEAVPDERLAKKRFVWGTDNPKVVVKYLRCKDENWKKRVNEWLAAVVLRGTRLTPEFFGARFEDLDPTGEPGIWLTLYFERFPCTLRQRGKKLDAAQTRQLIEVVRQIHLRGVCQGGDINPDNVVVRELPDGRLDIRVIDFGLAVITKGHRDHLYYEGLDWGGFEISSMKSFITPDGAGKKNVK